MVKTRKQKTETKAQISDDRDPCGDRAANGEQREQTPLTAYILGHEATFVRMFQVQCWTGSTLLAGNAVLESLHEIEDHRLPFLLDAENDNQAFCRIREEFQRVMDVFPAEGRRPKPGTLGWLTEDSVGYASWSELTTYVSSLISEASPIRSWYELGKCLADFRLRLHLLMENASLGQSPSLRTVVHWADILKSQGWNGVSTIRELAACRERLGELSTPQILGNAIDTPHEILRSETPVLLLVMGILRQANRVDLKLRAELAAMAPNLEVGTATKPETDQQPFTRELMDEVQKSILDALDGKAMMKDELVSAIGLPDSSLLYRNHRMRKLKEKGLVDNKRGLGYYRPDAPPLEFEFSSYSRELRDRP